MSKILVAGFGNTYMGDDGFGPSVIEALMAKDLPGDVEARDAGLCGSMLAPDLSDFEFVIFVDAVKKGGKLGTLYRTEIKAEEVKELKPGDAACSFTLSIHDTGLENLLSFAKTIGTLPQLTVVIGCEILEISLGQHLSPAVEAAVQRAVDLILTELQGYRERQ
jgi:hydrogenase maturation protease